MSNSFLVQLLTLIRNLGPLSILRNLNYKISKKNKFSRLRRIKYKKPVGPFFSILQEFEEHINLYNNSWENKQTYFSWYVNKTSSIPDWNKLCLSGENFNDQEKDWHKIQINKPHKDIKQVWEASRMDWLITFSQKIYLGDKKYVAKINDWLEDWISSNPPYKGPNWTCSQEASIRIINFCLASCILKNEYKLNKGSIDFIKMHLERILPSMSYSISQQNNHATTEAAALFIGGLFLKNNDVKGSKDFVNIGKKILEERVSTLISSNGVFSQYSTNYQRMLIDTLTICEYWRAHFNEQKFTKGFYTQSIKSINWLAILVNDTNGHVPNLGSNDGSMLLPLIGNDYYRDFRLSVEFASRIFLEESVYEENESFLSFFAWLRLDMPKNKQSTSSSTRIASDGFLLIKSNSSLALLRYPDFKFRPCQEDILHFDLWINNKNILRDAGTYTYLRNNDNDYFTSSEGHNTVKFDDSDQMPRIGKFLYGKWPKSIETKLDITTINPASFVASYKDSNSNFHARSISFDEKLIIIDDRLEGNFQHGKLRWRLEPGEWKLDGNSIYKDNIKIEIIGINNFEEMIIKSGWESKFYMHKTEIPVLEVSFKGKNLIRTQVDWS